MSVLILYVCVFVIFRRTGAMAGSVSFFVQLIVQTNNICSIYFSLYGFDIVAVTFKKSNLVIGR